MMTAKLWKESKMLFLLFFPAAMSIDFIIIFFKIIKFFIDELDKRPRKTSNTSLERKYNYKTSTTTTMSHIRKDNVNYDDMYNVHGTYKQPFRTVSTEKRSKIVSIFTKKWLDIAYQEYVVIDIETTGLYKEFDYIIEVAAIKYQDGVETDKLVSLINPQAKIPQDAIRVHGITNKHVSKAFTIQEFMPILLSYLGDSLLVAHNASFDIGFIEVWARRLGYNPVWNYVDTISIAKRLLPGLPNYKQQTILDAIGFAQKEYHRAEADCRGCAEIMNIGINSHVAN